MNEKLINTECILGAGGTGKSFLLKKRIDEDPNYALLTASTGIAAVNLGEGVTTVHSALGFFDFKSLQEAAKRGQIRRKALDLASRRKKYLVIDEVSMFSADHLEIITNQFNEAAQHIEEKNAQQPEMYRKEPTGIITVGDFLQLSPIPETPKSPIKYAFESQSWEEHYQPNLTKLEKIHRQENVAFIEALKLARAGHGVDAALALKTCGVEFVNESDNEFDGITLFPVNSQVGMYNELRLDKVSGEIITVKSERWGKERGEWRNIPHALELKEGALVMILANQPKTFSYVNGDLATVTAIKTDVINETTVEVESRRNYVGRMPYIIRRNISFAADDLRRVEDAFEAGPDKHLYDVPHDRGSQDFKIWYARYMDYLGRKSMKGEPYYEPLERGVVVGEVRYMPLRLAYGSSYHKVQGLTLDTVQINCSHYWASQPGMLYVALTRCRTPEGVKIVGDVGSVAKKIKTDSRVRKWV